jgi:DNA-binding NtrC family response regulator
VQAGLAADDAATADVNPQTPEALLRPLSVQIAELEQKAIRAAMDASGGNKVAAAKLLGVARATLYSRLGDD